MTCELCNNEFSVKELVKISFRELARIDDYIDSRGCESGVLNASKDIKSDISVKKLVKVCLKLEQKLPFYKKDWKVVNRLNNLFSVRVWPDGVTEIIYEDLKIPVLRIVPEDSNFADF